MTRFLSSSDETLFNVKVLVAVQTIVPVPLPTLIRVTLLQCLNITTFRHIDVKVLLNEFATEQ